MTERLPDTGASDETTQPEPSAPESSQVDDVAIAGDLAVAGDVERDEGIRGAVAARAATARGDSLTSLVTHFYQELRGAAQGMFGPMPPEHTLQPTALVNEAYVRLRRCRRPIWRTPTHFFSLAARVMRQALVDHTRLRTTNKRGNQWTRVGIGHATEEPDSTTFDPELLTRTLERLGSLHPRQRRIVELRFLQGRSVEQVASMLGVSQRTVKADWRMARAWMMRELRGRDCDG